MIGSIKKSLLIFMVIVALSGNVFGGWLKFEPNLVVLDGSAFASKLKDIKKAADYTESRDMEGAKALMNSKNVVIVKTGNGGFPAEYLDYKEYKNNFLVKIKDENGNIGWVHILGLACEGSDGKPNRVKVNDIIAKKLKPLSNLNQ